MKKTFMSGIKPTAEIHIGNYLGALKNWVALGKTAPGFWGVVDMHALTEPPKPVDLRRWSMDLVEAYIAAGLDPEKHVIYLQSAIPEVSELNWIFTCLAGMGWLERMTQFKDKTENAKAVDAGLFCYPVLMAADVAIFKATHIPVGHDQIQHLELAREIIRRFNSHYGNIFPEPQPVMSQTPKILGLDGKAKMSKSLGNTIAMTNTREEIQAKLKTAVTDKRRVRKTDPGEPNDCNVYSLHKVFSPQATQDEVAVGCRSAGITCFDCKMKLADHIDAELSPYREKVFALRAQPEKTLEIVSEGNKKAKAITGEVMDEVRDAVGYLKT